MLLQETDCQVMAGNVVCSVAAQSSLMNSKRFILQVIRRLEDHFIIHTFLDSLIHTLCSYIRYFSFRIRKAYTKNIRCFEINYVKSNLHRLCK